MKDTTFAWLRSVRSTRLCASHVLFFLLFFFSSVSVFLFSSFVLSAFLSSQEVVSCMKRLMFGEAGAWGAGQRAALRERKKDLLPLRASRSVSWRLMKKEEGEMESKKEKKRKQKRETNSDSKGNKPCRCREYHDFVNSTGVPVSLS